MGFKSIVEKVKGFFTWLRARIKTTVDWVSDLWTDVNKKADVRIIAANLGCVAEGMLIFGFVQKITTFTFKSGMMYLGVIIALGAGVVFLYKLSKDALDGKK